MRLPVLLLAAALVAGCGANGPKRLSPQAYAQRADASCTRYISFAKTIGNPSGVKQLVKAVDRSLPVFDKTVAELRALRPPEGERRLAARWLATISRLRADLLDLRGRAAANDLSGVRRVVRRAGHDNDESNRLGTRLGMHVCNSS